MHEDTLWIPCAKCRKWHLGEPTGVGLQNFLEGCYQNLPTPIETHALAPKALMLAPFRLTKTSQFSLRRGWNISYFKLTCSYGPGSCHSAATLDTKLA